MISSKNINLSLWKNSKEYFSYLNISLVFVPIFLIILNNSTLYSVGDIFIFISSLLLISIAGLDFLFKVFKNKKIPKQFWSVFVYSFFLQIF